MTELGSHSRDFLAQATSGDKFLVPSQITRPQPKSVLLSSALHLPVVLGN